MRFVVELRYTDDGVEGWGEGWGHVTCPTTSAALASLVGPAFIGRDVSDRGALMSDLARPVTAGNDPHTAVLLVGVVQRDPE